MPLQRWKPVNLDKRESYGSWGLLDKGLFNGSPHCLNQNLRVPGPPPLPACDMLLFPFKPGALYDEADKRAATYFPQAAVQLSALVNLPVELIQEIHYDLEDIRDIICLSVTCQPLWEVGRREIYRRLMLLTQAPSWAGDRIICVGEYLQNNDIPDHILTSEEKEEFTRQRPAPHSERHYTLYSYPFRKLRSGHAEFSIDEFLIPAKLPCHVYNSLLSMVNFPYTTSQPTKSAMAILRNLSRHQYVRESALGRWQARSKKAGFGEIVISRICRSSYPSASTGYTHGVWAGDRFDIVSSEWLEGLDNDAGLWTDVSEEVLAEILLIWASL
ncbi:hypothetical protein C8R45DRAFT_1143212 [Mycena sanguinolenta]|nr:hypothetical protein C8R45DRAFT_1143212 [Mycena sanguinolenta]